MSSWNKTIQWMNRNPDWDKRSMQHSTVVNGKTITADSEEELKQKIKEAASSSNGKREDSDSSNQGSNPCEASKK